MSGSLIHPPDSFVPGSLISIPADSDPIWFLASVGDYRMTIGLAPVDQSALGVFSFQKHDKPQIMGLPGPALGQLDSGASVGEVLPMLTLGPVYKEADGSWVPLAGVPADWCEIEVQRTVESNELIKFQLEYRIGGGPTIWEHYTLTTEGLTYTTEIEWTVGGFRLQLPVFLSDGNQTLAARLNGPKLSVAHDGHVLRADAKDEALEWERDPMPYSNSLGTFQNLYLQGRSLIEFTVNISIT